MKNLSKASILGGLGLLGNAAFAVPLDFAQLTTAADFSGAVTSVLTVGANIMLVYIAIKGFRVIASAIKG